MIGRNLFLAIVVSALAVGASAFAIHRVTFERALSTLRLAELQGALEDARTIARENHELLSARGLPESELRRRMDRMDRAALVLEQVRLLPDELSASLAARAFAPYLLGLALLGTLFGFFVARQLRPISEATAAARAWASGDEGRFPLGPAGARDVTELRTALDAMVAGLRSQRLLLTAQARALGWRQVASETSHELKNLLTPVRMAAERLAERGEGRDEEALLSALGPLERLARGLGDLSRREPLEPRQVVVREALASCAALHAARGVAIDVDAPGDLLVLADPGALGEALANLVVNAVEAGAGQVRLTGTRNGDQVILACIDDGPGLAELPPPGTSGKRGGSGFGLAFARRVAQESGGTLALLPSARGTTLVMELPDADPARRR